MARVPITEAARQLGLSPDSIRRRIRKGDLPSLRDNRGQWWVEVPDNLPPASAPNRHSGTMVAPAYAPMQTPDTALADTLRAQVADLTVRLDRAERRLEVAEAAALAERTTAQAERDRLLTMLEAARRTEPTSLMQEQAAPTPVLLAETSRKPAERVTPETASGPTLRKLLVRLLRRRSKAS